MKSLDAEVRVFASMSSSKNVESPDEFDVQPDQGRKIGSQTVARRHQVIKKKHEISVVGVSVEKCINHIRLI